MWEPDGASDGTPRDQQRFSVLGVYAIPNVQSYAQFYRELLDR